ncbi:MAG: T9SS type A sorting domain-containing protein [Bacteroidia bacterium]|nr:T9SS type A sorting domain-containing protein [Bacteroidia bacterium]
MKFKVTSQILFLMAALVLVQTNSYAQTFVPKKGGVCFRFDDYQKPADLERMRALFNKHNVKFTYALNTGIGEIFGDSAYWNVLKRIENDGHELADQSPTDVSHFFETKTPEMAQTYVGRPGIDHVTSGSNKVCLKYQILSTAGAGDESKVDVRRDTIISRANGEFAWTKLINIRYTTHFYLPGANQLVSIFDVKNANPNNPDTIILRNFWKEAIDLGTFTNVDYRKLTPFDISISSEGLQTMMEFSQRIFSKNGLKLPTSFIHPGGAHPYVSADIIKRSLEPLGFKGGASYPYVRFGLSYHNPLGLNQYLLQGGDITPENNSLADCKRHISEYFAKNNIVVSINHFNSLGAAYSFDQMMLSLEQLIIWCKTNNIPIKTYKEWVQVISESYFDQTFDIFPPLQNDFDKDGKIDGLEMANPNLRDTVNGLPYNKNVCLTIASNNAVFNFNRVYGLSRGKNTISISTKGGKDIYDYLSMVVDMPEANISRTYAVYTNTPNYTERNFDIEVPIGVTYLNLILNYNTQNNQRIYISGIKIKAQKKPSFRAAVIKRVAHEAFKPVMLSDFAACNGFTPAQLQFAILRAPVHLQTSLVGLRELHIMPKTNRFWVGSDSMQVRVRAPDNTADTAWVYFLSDLGKVCKDAFVPLSINRDSVNDQSYLWSAIPNDPLLSPNNAAKVWVRPVANTRYAANITFKNASSRRDSVLVEVLPSKLVWGTYDKKHFGSNNSLSYTLNYPEHMNVWVYSYPGSNAEVEINNKTVTITKPAGFSGVLETELYISSPTCDATIHTLASSTFPTSLAQLEKSNTLLVYPNPTNSWLNLSGLENGTWKCMVYDLKGELILESECLVENKIAQKLCLDSVKSGIYILKIQSENQIFTTKIIKN